METMLIIEDERLLGTELKRRYEREGWNVALSADLGDARHLIVDLNLQPLVVLSDMNLPDGNGLDFLDEVRKQGAHGEWIFLSGYGQPTDVARAMKLGAIDFLEKPLDQDKLDLAIATARRGGRAMQRLSDAASSASRLYTPQSYVGTSPQATRVVEMLRQFSTIPLSSVLLSGETGTGKGLVAKILHYSGQRAEGPFVEVNCAAFPKDLLESELFGHEPGAFTGAKNRHRGLLEQADGGSIFLDELGDMDLGLQSKLLTAIESQQFRRVGGERPIKVDVRLIAASNRNLLDEVQAARFRSDLYHRISVFEIALPSLRERLDDIEELVGGMITEFNQKAGRHVAEVPQAAWRALRDYDWPGNVRELRNVIERSVLLSRGPQLPLEWLGLPAQRSAAFVQAGGGQASEGGQDSGGGQQSGDWIRLPLDGSMALEDMDRYIITRALEQHDFNVMATARALGTTRETLRYRMQKYAIVRAG